MCESVRVFVPLCSTPTGVVYDCTWDNITIINPRKAATYINVYIEDGCTHTPPVDKGPLWLTAHDFKLFFTNIHATVGPGVASGCAVCAPGTPCKGINWENVTVTGSGGATPAPYVCFNAHGGDAQGSSPAPCPA